MDKIKLLEILSNKNFVVKNSEFYLGNHEEFIHCFNEDKKISLIIKEYETKDNTTILNDVMKVRKILRENNVNIWNSYFLILLNQGDSENIDVKNYGIERNSQGLRKYVINDNNDVYRMPFIKKDDGNSTKLDFTGDFKEILKTDDSELQDYLNWLIDTDGDMVEIKKKVIKEKINELIKG